MKDTGHPKYHKDTVVTCACGTTFVTGSTAPKINVDICSKCHPFFTGTQKFIDTEGRVEKFAKRQAIAEKANKSKKEKDQKKEEVRITRTLKEMLSDSKAVKE